MRTLLILLHNITSVSYTQSSVSRVASTVLVMSVIGCCLHTCDTEYADYSVTRTVFGNISLHLVTS